MKNVYKLNEFLKIRKEEKLNEADRFANDVAFSESLVGRLFNNIFSFFRKSIYFGLLMIYKRKLEDAYFEGVLKAMVNSKIPADQIKKQQAEYNPSTATADNLADDDVNDEEDDEEDEKSPHEEPVEVSEDEAIKIYMEYATKTHEELQNNHLIIKNFIEGAGDNPYNPETATIKDYTKLKKGLDYLWVELKEIEAFFKKDAYDSGFNKAKNYMDIPMNRDAILAQMKKDITEKYANFRKEKNADLRDAMRNAMESTIEDWDYISAIILEGVKKLQATKDKSLETIYNKLKAEIDKKLTSIPPVKKQKVEEPAEKSVKESKLYEADNTEIDSEKAAKSDETMEQKYPGDKEALKDYGKLKAGDINGSIIRDKFSKDPSLLTSATDLVNKEKLKDIQLSAEILYHRDEKTQNSENRGLLTKNFRAGDKEKYALETKWKKMVAKVKKNYVGLLDVDALDPIVLVNQDTNMRNKALNGEVTPKALEAGKSMAYTHLLDTFKDKMHLEFKFPDGDFWWCVLRYGKYGLLAFKFNLPESNPNNYIGQHLSFFIHSVYDWDKIDLSNPTKESIENALVKDVKLGGKYAITIPNTGKLTLIVMKHPPKDGARPAFKGNKNSIYLIYYYNTNGVTEPQYLGALPINLNIYPLKSGSDSTNFWSNDATANDVSKTYGEYQLWMDGTSAIKPNNLKDLIIALKKTNMVEKLKKIWQKTILV